MLEIRALGALEIVDDDIVLEAVLAQPKRAALLAYLATARPRGFHRRDTLLALFWPELDEGHARNALSQALSFLRRALNDAVVVTRGGEEVGVDVEGVRCDVIAFEEAVDSEQWAGALALYRGDLLTGFHVAEAVEFDPWLEAERTRLRELAAGAAWSLAHQHLAVGEPVEAERAAQRALHLAPTDETPVRVFIEALARAGDRAAALRFYERFTSVLEAELEVEPAPETAAVARTVRDGLETGRTSGRPAARVPLPEVSAGGPVEAGRTAGQPSARLRGHPPRRATLTLLAAAVLVPAGYVTFGSVLSRDDGDAGTRSGLPSVLDMPAVAVLPLRWLDGPAEERTLAESIPLEVIHQLSTLDSVAVVDGGASFKPGLTVLDAGQVLKVGAVLTGEIMSDGAAVQMRLRLLDTSSGAVLWSESFKRERSSLMTLPRDIALGVASALGVTPTSGAGSRLTAPTRDPIAYRQYLRARHLLFHELTPASLGAAMAALNEAIARDPAFALAHALKAHVHILRIQTEDLAAADGWPSAIRSANRALALDSTVASAYAALAVARLFWDWDWGTVRPLYERAIALNPDDAAIRAYFGQYLHYVERDHLAAIEQLLEARRLDPTNPFVGANLAWRYIDAGQWEEGRAVLDEAEALDPQFWVTHWARGTLELRRGDPEAAIACFGRAVEDSRGGVVVLPDLATALVRAGQEDSARSLLHRLQQRRRTRHVSPTLLARIHLALGEEELFFELLEEAHLQRDLDLFWLISGWEVEGATLREEGRLLEFMERAGVRAWYRPYRLPG